VIYFHSHIVNELSELFRRIVLSQNVRSRTAKHPDVQIDKIKNKF